MGKIIIGTIGAIIGVIVDQLISWLYNKVNMKNPYFLRGRRINL